MSESEDILEEKTDELYDSVDGVQSTTLLIDQELIDDIVDLIESESVAALLNIVLDLHAADLAALLNHLSFDQARAVFALLSSEDASEVIVELDDDLRERLLEELSTRELSDIVEELDSDDAVDIVSELDEETAQEVLAQLSSDDSAELRELLSFEPDTAGGLMKTETALVSLSATVQDAVESVRALAEDTTDIYEVFVVDEDQMLRGTVDLKSLLLNPSSRRISEIMNAEVISVRTDVDQETVANVMRKYDLVIVPVVDEGNHPVGVITFDDIADVMHEEATEDIQRLSGVSDSSAVRPHFYSITRSRIPWLLLGFAGEILAALVLERFQASMQEVLASAFFIPIIMAMGGNSGTQSSTVVVRGLATGEISYHRVLKRLSQEFLSALLTGTILGLLLLGVVHIWIGDTRLGLTVGASLLVVITNATVFGATVPLILNRMKFDPALATGPFISTSNDALGLLIYLGFLTLIYH